MQTTLFRVANRVKRIAELSINSVKTSNLGLTCSYYDLTLLIEIYLKACLALSPAAILPSNSIGVFTFVCVGVCVLVA